MTTRFAVAPLVALAALGSVAAAGDATSRFATDLWKEVARSEGNLVASPYSIAQALDLLRSGARGKTREEIDALLHENPAKLDIESVQVANHLWGQEGYAFKPSFSIDRIDFKDAEGARRKINSRIAEETKNRIQDLLPNGTIDEATRLIVTNALYMNPRWETPFPQEATSAAPFHRLDGSTVSVPLMQASLYWTPRGHSDDVDVVELPYKGDRLVMDAILPKDARTYALDVDAAVALLKERGAIVSLPRFEVTSEVRLKPVLETLGMKLAFDATHADFSGFTDSDPLYVSEAITKTFVKVDEKGTEAAAATAVIVEAGAACPQHVVQVKFDRTFFFAIRDTKTGTVLFTGRVDEPELARSAR